MEPTKKKTKAVLTPEQKVKYKKGKCITMYCRNSAKHGYYCNSCKYENRKKFNPIKIVYENVKSRAKKINTPFNLSMQWFSEWCTKNKYLELKGRFKDSMSIDRINPELGYTEGNLQLLTVSSNSRKKYVDYYRQQHKVPEDYCHNMKFTESPISNEQLPF